MEHTYLCEEGVYNEIKNTSEKLISHEDGEEEVTEHEGTSITSWILPDAGGGEDETNKV